MHNKVPQTYASYKALYASYKIQNPRKYEQKKAAFDKKLYELAKAEGLIQEEVIASTEAEPTPTNGEIKSPKARKPRAAASKSE